MAAMYDDAELYADQKLIASRIDFFAAEDPDKIVASIPTGTSDLSRQYRDITAKSFACAIDRTAHWLDRSLAGHEKAEGRVAVFAYDGPVDLRWLLFFVAAIKTGRTIVFSHTHTAVDNLLHLYRGCNCHVMFQAEHEQMSPAVDQLKSQGFFSAFRSVPELSDFLKKDDTAAEPYLYHENWEAAADRKVVYFQSSGTTGPPKPIGHTNRSLIYWFQVRVLARSDDQLQLSVPPGKRIHCAYHISHVSGCWWYLLSMVYWDTITVFSSPHVAASIDIVKPVLECGRVDAAAYPPALLATIAKNPEVLGLVRKLQSISTGGMMLDSVSAATIYAHRDVRLQNNYGSTEMMIMPFIRLPQEDWPYLRFHPSAGVQMQPYTQAVDIGMPGNTSTIFENVIVRDDEKYQKGLQPVFFLFPELQSYHSKDLFKRHPTKDDLWIYYGRVDDTLLLENGRKVFVADMQRALQEDPIIAGAMVGVEGNVLFAIVELHGQELARYSGRDQEAVDAVWPAVERANALCATGDRVGKSAVILATPDRPFLRFGKLSVDRRGTYALYDREIKRFT